MGKTGNPRGAINSVMIKRLGRLNKSDEVMKHPGGVNNSVTFKRLGRPNMSITLWQDQ